MSYATEGDAGFKVTALSDPAGSLGGPIGSTSQRIVEDVPINAGENVTPVARPPRMIDARVVMRCLDLAAVADIDTAPGDCTTTIQCADGNSTGTVMVSPMVPRNADITAGHAEQAHIAELEYRMLGSVLTFTPTI